MWEEDAILGALEGLWKQTWPIDSRNMVTSCKGGNWRLLDKVSKLKCHKLHSACISTTSGLIFTNQVMLESPKWGLSAHMWDV